jgi:hypothetical protein
MKDSKEKKRTPFQPRQAPQLRENEEENRTSPIFQSRPQKHADILRRGKILNAQTAQRQI